LRLSGCVVPPACDIAGTVADGIAGFRSAGAPRPACGQSVATAGLLARGSDRLPSPSRARTQWHPTGGSPPTVAGAAAAWGLVRHVRPGTAFPFHLRPACAGAKDRHGL